MAVLTDGAYSGYRKHETTSFLILFHIYIHLAQMNSSFPLRKTRDLNNHFVFGTTDNYNFS